MERKRNVIRRSAFEYRKKRDRELLEVFNRELGALPGETVDEVLRRVVECPSRRFWVSEERALRVIGSMMNRPLPSGGSALRHEMFEEIKRRCDLLAVEHPDWPLSRRVFYVVGREAPRFYLSPYRAHVIICEERRRCRAEMLRRLRRY